MAPPARERTPVSAIDRFVVELDLIANAVPPVPDAVSLITKAVAVPALDKVKEVGVPKPPANEKAISRPVVVVIVLPAS